MTRINYCKSDKDMHVNTYLEGGMERQLEERSGSWQGKEKGMRHIKVRPQTFRRGRLRSSAQVTAHDEDEKGRFEPRGSVEMRLAGWPLRFGELEMRLLSLSRLLPRGWGGCES